MMAADLLELGVDPIFRAKFGTDGNVVGIFMAMLFGIYMEFYWEQWWINYMINSCKPWGIDAFQSRNLLAIFFSGRDAVGTG